MTEKKSKIVRKRGDRKDAAWARNLDGMHAIMVNLFPNRTESEVYMYEEADVTELLKYIERKNEDGEEPRVKPFHCFITALAKTVYHRPLLNRYIQGRRYYDRDDITFAFIVRRRFTDTSDEMLLVTPIEPEQGIRDVSRIIVGDTDELRGGRTSDIDKVLDVYKKLPRFLQRGVMAGFRTLDFHGRMPWSLCKDDTNHASVLVSNLGSIKCGACYHHLNNYGSNSVMVTIGEIKKKYELGADGNVIEKDVCDFGFTIDERIADGFYFARSIKLFEYILSHPETLDDPISEETGYEY